MRNDPQWKTFCRPSGGAFSADESSTANQAETQLAACLKQLELPYKFTMTQRIEDIKEEIKSMEGHGKFTLSLVVFLPLILFFQQNSYWKDVVLFKMLKNKCKLQMNN